MEKVSSGDDTYLRFNYLEAFPENADIRLITTTTFNETALISTHLGEVFAGDPLPSPFLALPLATLNARIVCGSIKIRAFC